MHALESIILQFTKPKMPKELSEAFDVGKVLTHSGDNHTAYLIDGGLSAE